ncbi:MAG: hypothetical protein E7164_03210 [Firmicutes bacterium]|nr:hypothetical protein [Bacillota bacterium]
MITPEQKLANTRRKIKIICFCLLGTVILWFSLVLTNLYRVKIDKKPLICMGQYRDIEDNDEYSLTCYGILYKYREYHYTIDDSISAKEFTLIFKDFVRKSGDK